MSDEQLSGSPMEGFVSLPVAEIADLRQRLEAAELYIRRTESAHTQQAYALDVAREELDALRAGDKGLLVDRCNALEELRERQMATIKRLVAAGNGLELELEVLHGQIYARCSKCPSVEAMADWRKAVEESTFNVRDGG